VILLCTLGVAAVALGRLAQVLAAERVAAGTVAWIAAALGVLAAGLARRHDTANATLVVGLAVAVVPVSFFTWAVGAGAAVQRAMLLLSVVALALGTVALRDRHPTHAAQLANAGGLALVGIVAAPLLERLDLAGGGGPGWGWELPRPRRRGSASWRAARWTAGAGPCSSACSAGGLLRERRRRRRPARLAARARPGRRVHAHRRAAADHPRAARAGAGGARGRH
jgi:hypothetical protein